MKKIPHLSLLVCLLLVACNAAGTTLLPTSILTPTVVAGTPVAKTPEPAAPAEPSPSPTPKTVGFKELGVTDKGVLAAFKGMEKFIQKESEGKYFVSLNGEKYYLQDGWNLYPDLKEAFAEKAPSTVNAIDKNGEKVTLIWNSEGLHVNEPLSTDPKNPTEFDDSTRLTFFQRYILSHQDPFTSRAKGNILRTEMTENGRVTYLRTDVLRKNNSRSSDVFGLYTSPDGQKYLVNPADINDNDYRKVVMCAYPPDYDLETLAVCRRAKISKRADTLEP